MVAPPMIIASSAPMKASVISDRQQAAIVTNEMTEWASDAETGDSTIVTSRWRHDAGKDEKADRVQSVHLPVDVIFCIRARSLADNVYRCSCALLAYRYDILNTNTRCLYYRDSTSGSIKQHVHAVDCECESRKREKLVDWRIGHFLTWNRLTSLKLVVSYSFFI